MKTWIVIPAMGLASAVAAILPSGIDPLVVASAGLAGAAMTAAIRALGGESPAMIVAAVLAPLLLLASLAEHDAIDVVACTSLAAIGWTIVELARPSTSPLVAMLPATIAGVLEPAAIALAAIAGTRVMSWRERPRWAIGLPVAGVLAVMLAIVAGAARDGAFADLAARWFGSAPAPIAPDDLAVLVGDALGPLVAVAAPAGLVLIARLRLAEVALVTCAIGAVLVDLRAGFVGAATLGLASACAAFAVGRFAATIRLPPIQAIAGATAAAMVLLPPAWTVVESLR